MSEDNKDLVAVQKTRTASINNLIGRQNAVAHFIKADRKKKTKLLAEEPGSKATDNPTGETADGQGIIEPSYELAALAQIRESNNAIIPMVDAYKTNIAGFGYGLRYNIDMQSLEIDQGMKDQAKKEWVLLDNFYKYCNFDQSFTDILQRMIDDKEYLGFGVLEVLEDTKGTAAGFDYIPAHTLKISKLDTEFQVVELNIVGADGKNTKVSFQKRFRKFKQEVDNSIVYFKEFGDPRKLDRFSGIYETDETEVDPNNYASGLILFSNEVPYSVYGLPRWIGNYMGMNGSRKSEELNYRYFTNGRHTPLAILVNNGSLTESSMDVIKGYVNDVQGVENAFGYLVLEATGYEDETGDSEVKNVDIKLQPLTETLQTDALFQNYDEAQRNHMREAMRLAPIYTGASKDYTRATADVARAITEEQVFQPERKKISNRINRLINQALGVKYVDMILKGPDITNKTDLANAIAIYNRTGAVTPNLVMQALSDLVGQEFEEIQADWANLPLSIVLEMVKKGSISMDDLKTKNDGPTYTDDKTSDKSKKE